MAVREITPNVYSVGVVDWDREIFDELLPLPDGTTYNSYLVIGSEKTALIDAVDSDFEEEFITNLACSGATGIDYLVVNHAEQDHSGSIPVFLELFPSAKIVTSEKCKELLMSLHFIPEFRIIVVKDNETLSLGDKTLEFMETPWAHWPDTMLTFLKEDGILFSCDLFGAHYASSSLFIDDEHTHYLLAKRYFAEIMMPFRKKVSEYVERVSSYDIQIIAPSHGPMYNRPEYILDICRKWSSDEVKNRVIIPYISMHGSTKKMVSYLTESLIARGIEVRPFNLGKTDSGRLAMELLDAATIVIATPTVLFGPHPKVANIAFISNILKPKAKAVGIIGSYGWGGKTVKDLSDMIQKLDVELLEPVYIRGLPNEEAFLKLDEMADDILNKHKEYNIA
ncbi:FprA family A-type flavoprotein [Methanoplanus sp. FWC-SCC4]|uniref:FprA family A-type flavoprotein n=1 Tax=Methanochimaera problematica TaxID=2609417 RepID=A0AA97F9Z0_9EURY|nr:FprA family A-type flavoprotein [Methanoplanus sp. FWC-SCC4]WOF15575.1 FprA family A-type flavoprotein [Methanoplanus sp. FWC-SCC4]